MRRLSNLRVNRAQAIVPNRQYRIIKSAATRSASQYMFATLARVALDFLTARIEFIGRCTSPFNLRLQFFKNVECNGTDTNVVKDSVEPKDEIRFPAPDWLRCNGSRWVLKVDEGGVRHQSDLRKNPS